MLSEAYDIELVPDAEVALQAMENTDFNGLLVDINLGEGLGGTELLRRPREEKLAQGAPAITVTAYAMPGDRQEFLEEGFDEYVGKPFTGADLRAPSTGFLSPGRLAGFRKQAWGLRQGLGTPGRTQTIVSKTSLFAATRALPYPHSSALEGDL